MDYNLEVGKLDLELEKKKISGHGMCPHAIVLQMNREDAIVFARNILATIANGTTMSDIMIAGNLSERGTGFRRLAVGDNNYDSSNLDKQYP